MPTLTWPEALARIADRAQQVDQHALWPRDNMEDLLACGALGWAIPKAFGGSELPSDELQQRYGQLAGACLTTALVLTQRDSAISFFAASANTPLVTEILPRMARGALFATIGIAQLTTSRQHVAPPVTAAPAENGFYISGSVPWVTGARHAQRICVGAVLPDGQQLLVALRTSSPGAAALARMQLPALSGSFTGEFRLEKVMVAREDVLQGPTVNALAARSANRGFALPTCVLPLGLAGAALADATTLLETQGDAARGAIGSLQRQHAEITTAVFEAGLNPDQFVMSEVSPRLRAQANVLAMRCALAALELAKGRGFLTDSPAQRRVREAMFFFVWSSPRTVIEQTLSLLVG